MQRRVDRPLPDQVHEERVGRRPLELERREREGQRHLRNAPSGAAQRHVAAKRLELLGVKYHTHTAFAKLPHEVVRPNDYTGRGFGHVDCAGRVFARPGAG